MIRCVLFASVALHVAMIAVLPDARPLAARAMDTPSLVEVTSAPPPKEEPPPEPEVAPTTPQPATANRPPVSATAHVAATVTGPVSDAPPSLAVDGDGPADFTASVISNAGPRATSKIVVNAPVVAAPSPAKEPAMVPVSSLSRRPGAPGLDADLERNYPASARRAGISGTAKLRVAIHADGRVGRVERISESYAGFGDACAKTVRAARWEPPLDKDGRATSTEIVYVCKFEVRS